MNHCLFIQNLIVCLSFVIKTLFFSRAFIIMTESSKFYLNNKFPFYQSHNDIHPYFKKRLFWAIAIILESYIKSILTNLTEKSSNYLNMIGTSTFNKIKEFEAFL